VYCCPVAPAPRLSLVIVKAFNSNNLQTDITIKGTMDAPLFRASDIGEILGLSNIGKNMLKFNEIDQVITICYNSIYLA
jgi:hypothetical protein